MKKEYCDICKNYVPYTVEERIIAEYKGYVVNVPERVGICTTCSEVLYVPELEEENFRVLYEKYRNEAKIISVDAIVTFREKYQLSQRELTAILNWGKMTINRYERGAIPSQSHNDYLQLLLANEHEFVKKTKDAQVQGRIGERTLEKVLSQAAPAEKGTFRTLTINALTHPESEYNGFRSFDIERTIHLISYIANKVTLFKTSMNKFLWYMDFLSFKEHQRSITGLQYMRYYHGPIIEKFYYENLLLHFDETYETNEFEEGDCIKTIIRSKENFDLTLFKDREKIIIERVLKTFQSKSSSDISSLSHQEQAWQELEDRALISYTQWAPLLRLEFLEV